MTQAFTSFATAPDHGKINISGFDWLILRRTDHHVEAIGARTSGLELVTLFEQFGQDDGTSTFKVRIVHPTALRLNVWQEGFTRAEDAVAWAVAFEWPSRQAGSLTWVAVSADDECWYTRIGQSAATIYVYQAGAKGVLRYGVKRTLTLGNQSIEFSVTDLSLADGETRNIASFEQASAIALTMTDYVMELMRVPAGPTPPAGPAA